MVRVSLKNTFLELRCDGSDDEEQVGPSTPSVSCSPVRRRTTGRSRSLEGTPSARRAWSCEASPLGDSADESEAAWHQELETQLASLNRLLGSPFRSEEVSEQISPFFPPERAEAASSSSRRFGLQPEASRASSSHDDGCSVCSDCSANASTGTPPKDREECSEYPAISTRMKDYRHKQVPKTHDLKSEFEKNEKGQPQTTLMLRNIPNKLAQSDLIAELERLGFDGTYDFLYVPQDRGSLHHRHHGKSKAEVSNVGYAFVNFVDPAWADRCEAVFQDRVFPGSSRQTRVSPAHVQGLAANLAHYKKAAVKNDKLKECRPLIMPSISHRLGCLPPAPR